MDPAKKDAQKTLTHKQLATGEVLQTTGKAMVHQAQKLSAMYANAKNELLNPDQPEPIRINTLEDQSVDFSSSHMIDTATQDGDQDSRLIASKPSLLSQKEPVHVSTLHVQNNDVYTNPLSIQKSDTGRNAVERMNTVVNKAPQHNSLLHAQSHHTEHISTDIQQRIATQNNETAYNTDISSIDAEGIHESVYEKLLKQSAQDQTDPNFLYDQIKTLANRAFSTEEQIEALSMTGKALDHAGHAEKILARSSKCIQSMDEDDGTGRKIYGQEIKQQASKHGMSKGKKYAKKSVLKVVNNKYVLMLRKVMTKAIKTLINKILITTGITAIGSVPVMIFAVILILFLSIFGGGDTTIVGKYETYMNGIQEAYDAQVDHWLEENPNGIVVGIRGGYGDIDWKVPLSILQGTYYGLEFDQSERNLLDQFNRAGLFETHEEVTDTIEKTDGEGNVEQITIKYLIIHNPGYQDYMKWLDQNYTYLNNFKIAKGLSPSDQMIADEKESIDSLYQSDMFFDSFSQEFQDHDVITGSNESEQDFNSAEYNLLNPFTNAGFKGQCTWYAYGRALKVSGKQMPLGNAVLWLQNARAMGLATGTAPGANAVVVLAGNTYGHVAFVESWNGEQITISEGNFGNPCTRSDATCDAVSYAREHAQELVHEETYDTFEAYKEQVKTYGLTVIGFIYTN